MSTSRPSAARSRGAPSFQDFSRSLREKRVEAVDPGSLRSISPHAAPDFVAVPYELTKPAPVPSSAINDFVDPNLVPAPLSVYKHASTAGEPSPEISHLGLQEEQERCESRFSKTPSEGSYVIYTGIRESVRAYVRYKLQRKRNGVTKERERVMSIASAKYPGMLTAKEYDRRFSTDSRRQSVQQSVASIYNRISRLSMSGLPSPSKEAKQQPRTRRKQRAISPSPYQKYGAAVWQAPKRQKRTKRRSAPAETVTGEKTDSRLTGQPSRSVNPVEVADAFKSGRNQILDALHDTKQRLKRSLYQKRRDDLKQRIRLVGPSDRVSDGTKTYAV